MVAAREFEVELAISLVETLEAALDLLFADAFEIAVVLDLLLAEGLFAVIVASSLVDGVKDVNSGVSDDLTKNAVTFVLATAAILDVFGFFLAGAFFTGNGLGWVELLVR